MYDAQKDIYAVSSSSIIFAAIKLYKIEFFTQCFDCADARKQFGIISDTHVNIISEILLNIIFRKTFKLVWLINHDSNIIEGTRVT